MTDGYEETFGAVLRAARLAAGHSQESLARVSGVSAREINYLETGKVRRPRRSTIDALAIGLGTDTGVQGPLSHHAQAVTRPFEAALVPRQLPAVAAHTVGLDRHLATTAEVAKDGGTVAICGMPGVGKTTFAIRLASQLCPYFPDGQIFADLHGYDEQAVSPEQALGYMIRALQGASAFLPPGVEERSALFRSLLAGRRVLLVLDNARHEAQLRPLLPGSADCATILTSRNVLGGLDVRHRLHLDVLSVGDALTLLELIGGDQRIRAEPDRALEVVTACGGLPLAIRIVATRLATRPGLSLADLADRLADKRRRIRELAVGDIAVDSAFDLSYRMLTDQERLLFRRISLAPRSDVSTAAAAVLADLPEGEAKELLDALADANLLEPSSSGSRYRMHDLVRLYARHLTAATEPEAERAIDLLSAWYIAMLKAATRLTTPGFASLPADSGPAAATAFDNAQQAAAWLDAESAGIVATVVRSARQGPYPPAWLLADALRGPFYVRRDTDAWLTAAQAGLAAARHAGDRTAIAAMLSSLGMARASRSQFGLAMSHYRQAVSLADEWPVGRAAALGNLGIVYYTLGQLDDAQRCYELSLAVNREIGNRHGEAIRLGNLAGLCHATDTLPESSRRYTQALAIYRELGNRHGEALTSCSYANVCVEMGRPDEALVLVEAALTLAGQLGSKVVEAVAKCVLAVTCMALRRDHDAYIAALQARACSQSIDDGIVQVDSLNVLGDVERSRADTVSSAIHHTQAHARAKQVGYRLGEIEALIGLATSICASGNPAEAESYAQQAVTLAAAVGHRRAERRARACLHDLRAQPADSRLAGAK